MTLARRLTAEALGTAMLLAAIVGSGIMGERLAGGSLGLALLANSIATGGALLAIALSLGPVSGAQLNPAITLADVYQGGLSRRDAAGYVAAQLGGALLGVGIAEAMFEEPLFALSGHARSGAPQLLAEFVATFGLVVVAWTCARRRPAVAPVAVAAYVTAAYWFTASTSFANPVVTVARALTDTFAGIRPVDVPGFIAAQLLGAATAAPLVGWLVPALPTPGAPIAGAEP